MCNLLESIRNFKNEIFRKISFLRVIKDLIFTLYEIKHSSKYELHKFKLRQIRYVMQYKTRNKRSKRKQWYRHELCTIQDNRRLLITYLKRSIMSIVVSPFPRRIRCKSPRRRNHHHHPDYSDDDYMWVHLFLSQTNDRILLYGVLTALLLEIMYRMQNTWNKVLIQFFFF